MTTDSIPIIDLTLLKQGTAGKKQLAIDLGMACRGIGFFYLTGHGLSEGLRERVFQLSADFFALPGASCFIPLKQEIVDMYL